MRLALFAVVLALSQFADAGSSSIVIAVGYSPNAPAVRLQLPADYVAVPISIQNDSKDPVKRADEIEKAFRSITEKLKQHPDLKKFSGNPLWSDQARLRIFVRNSGRRVGRYLRLHLKFPPADFVKIADPKQSLHKIDELYSGRQARQYVQNVNVYHPGMDTSIAELGLSFSAVYASQKSDEPVISWVLFADEMSPREGELFLNDLGWQELPVA